MFVQLSSISIEDVDGLNSALFVKTVSTEPLQSKNRTKAVVRRGCYDAVVSHHGKT